MRRAVYATTLGTRCNATRAESPAAARGRARLKVDIAMVALARRIGAARGAARTNHFIAGEAAHLIFSAGNLMTAGAMRDAIDTQRRLIDMAGKGMSRAARPATFRTDFGAGRTDGLLRNRAAQLMVRTSPMPTFFSLVQTDITHPGAIDSTCSQRMLNAAPALAASADLRARLTDKMRVLFAIAELSHRAATSGAYWTMNDTAQRINIKRYWQRRQLQRCSLVRLYLEGIAMQWAKDSNRIQQAGANDEPIALAGHLNLALFFRLLLLLLLLGALLFFFQASNFLFGKRRSGNRIGR